MVNGLLTIACSILLSMATTLAPDALWGGGGKNKSYHKILISCLHVLQIDFTFTKCQIWLLKVSNMTSGDFTGNSEVNEILMVGLRVKSSFQRMR